MANKLFSLFDDKLRAPSELVAGPTQNLDSIGQIIDSDAMLRKIQEFEVVRPKVDYSDFTNFVFFNSALDYFNITGEKLLNEYPYDGTDEDKQHFHNSLDDYQRYVSGVWPRTKKGHLKFYPPSGFAFVSVDDVGKENGVTQTSLLNPSTGSFSIEFWALNPPTLTGSDDVMVVLQKASGSLTESGVSVYYSGSNLYFKCSSGSTVEQISVKSIPGDVRYFCFTFNRSSEAPIMSAFSGSTTEFPVLVTNFSSSLINGIDAGSSRLLIGSGSVGTKVIRPFSGSLDDVRFWKRARSLQDISSSFNARISAQDDLFGLWRFNESGSNITATNENIIAFDYSGHKLHGVIQNYFTEFRSTGSLMPFDDDDLILTLNAPEVQNHISEQQLSGTIYDRFNDNIINKLLPEQFFLLEEFKNTNVLMNFVYVLGRYFDQIKVSIDQFTKVTSTNYGKFNQAPDALLQDVARFFGWEFTGNFLDSDVVQYLLGKQVLANTAANKAIDVKLYEIKNEFWKRTLINLMHLYKTKGTRESVESLLRIYGVNKSFIRLKEYGLKPNAGITTYRVASEKSSPALTFGSGSTQSVAFVSSKIFDSKVRGIETRVRFPTETSSGLTGSIMTGSIWSMNSSSDGSMIQQLYFTKDAVSSRTGSLIYTGSDGALVLSGLPIFDNRWYNVVVNRDHLSSSLEIDVQLLDRDEIVFHKTASLFTPLLSGTTSNVFWLGTTGSLPSEMWVQEARVWEEPVSDVEMRDHALNFQSFGTEEINGLTELNLHWRLNEQRSSSAGGELYNSIFDFSGHGVSGSGMGFTPDASPYQKFLNSFNYIASPEYGWNEEKIRAIDATSVSPEEAFRDDPLVALEFNLTDALNEDISQILANLDSFNEIIGAPANRYRDSYPDLDILRTNYFKRLEGHVNFRVFSDLLEFFDRSFVDMIRRLIPARVVFLGDEFVVESHMLERPKLQWNYRRKEPEFQPEGRITVYIRT